MEKFKEMFKSLNCKAKYNHWLPTILKVHGITLINTIYFAKKITVTKRLVQHELIHINQIKRDGVVGFYTKYLKEYIRNRIDGMSHHDAYMSISYEMEAYYGSK